MSDVLTVLASRDHNSTTDPLPTNIVHGTHSELIAFLTLNFVPSHFGLPLLVAVILFSKKVQRHPTFINLCLTFIITGVSSCLLLYAGKITGDEPSKMLCLLQASLLYGMPPMTAGAAFALIFQMWATIKASHEGRNVRDTENPYRVWIMMIVPYIGLVVAALATAVFGSSHPNMISRNRRFFYCSVKADPITNTITIVAGLYLLATLVFECWTVVILYKRLTGMRRQGMKLDLSLELNLPIRILAFGLYIILAMSLSWLSISTPNSPVPDLAIASAATFVLLTFGTQPDILRALCFWKRDWTEPPANPSHSRTPSNGSSSIAELKKSQSIALPNWQWRFTRRPSV